MPEPTPLDHRAFVRERVPQVFGPRITAVLLGLAFACQPLEDILIGLLYDRAWPPAGFWLDRIAVLVGVHREQLTDALLLRLIEARILANRSPGTREAQLAVARALFPGLDVRQIDVYPAGSVYQIGFLDLPDFPPPDFMAQAGGTLRAGKPSGVGVGIVIYPTSYFGFDEDPLALGFDEGVWAESL